MLMKFIDANYPCGIRDATEKVKKKNTNKTFFSV